jgi:hypothetical protein
MSGRNLQLLILFGTLVVVLTSGCETHEAKTVINTNTLPGKEAEKLFGTGDAKVNNGVISFSDNAGYSGSSIPFNGNSSGSDFGPKEIQFAPQDVDPR